MAADNTRTGTLINKSDAVMKKKFSTPTKVALWTGGVTLTGIFTGLAAVGVELTWSPIASHYGTKLANDETGIGYSTKTVTTPPEARSAFDQRRGYANRKATMDALRAAGATVTEATERTERELFGVKLYSLDSPKLQAGATITDILDNKVYSSKNPRQIYDSFSKVPPLMWQSLLAIENRSLMDDDTHELLDLRNDDRNVAVDPRLMRAIAQTILKKGGIHVQTPGASPLAVQIQKILHSPGGQTHGDIDEKKRQIITALTKYYKDKDTKQIIMDYLALAPFAATKLDGEVFGFAEAMKVWYGRDLDEIGNYLNTPDEKLNSSGLQKKAQIYREVFSLIMALPKPSEYADGPRRKDGKIIGTKAERREIGKQSLEDQIDYILPAMVKKGIITHDFMLLVKAQRLQRADPSQRQEPKTLSPYKYVNNLRIKAQSIMKVASIYDFERYDVDVKTTLDGDLNKAVEEFGQKLKNPEFARQIGLIGKAGESKYLLDERDLKYVKLAVIMNERLPDNHNVVSVLTDNQDDGLVNLVSGGRIEMGSWEKFNFGLTIRQVFVGELFEKYAGQSTEDLQDHLKHVHRDDNLTRWAINYLLKPDTNRTSLDAMLSAADAERYSGNVGGTKVENFERKENGWNVSVSDNFINSVNAAFIRIFRDNLAYARYERGGVTQDMIDDTNHPQRRSYVEKGVLNDEIYDPVSHLRGSLLFLKDKNADEILMAIVDRKKNRSAGQLAAIYRELFPQKSVEDMRAFILANGSAKDIATLTKGRDPAKQAKLKTPPKDPFVSLYERYAPGAFDRPAMQRKTKTGEIKTIPATYDSNERLYTIREKNPLLLFAAKYLVSHPGAKFDEVAAAATKIDPVKGTSVALEVGSWAFKASNKKTQDRYIRAAIQADAYHLILKQAQAFGYPFKNIVYDERVVLGSNGNTPQSAAQLLQIVQNDGVMKKPDIFWSINGGVGTEYEYKATFPGDAGKQVMKVEVARNLRKHLQDVVQEKGGTGFRVKGAFQIPNPYGPGKVDILAGGKTGTGNNVVRAGNGKVLETKNRTATFAFIIGDRLHGTILLYLDGKQVPEIGPNSEKPVMVSPAARAHFTSAAATVTLKALFQEPAFQAKLARTYNKDTIIIGENAQLVPEKPKAVVAIPRIATNDVLPKPAAPAAVPN